MYPKKLLALISTITVIAIMLSIVGFLQDEIGVTDGIGMNYEAADAEELQELINSSMPGTNIKLTADIKLNGEGYINVEGKTVAIDLNGHLLDAGRKEWAEDGYAIRVCSGSLLSIKDTGGHGAIIGGNATYGGGIYIIEGGNVVISSGCVKYNKASVGGGGIYNAGTLHILGGEIYSNEAGTWGGGIYSIGTLQIGNGKIYSNTSGKDGGGIYSGGSTVIEGGTITMNVAQKSAGGLRISGGEVTIKGGEIKENEAHDDHGGGIYAADDCKLHLWGGRIIYNLAAQTGAGILVTPGCNFGVKGTPIVDFNTIASTGKNIMIRTGAVINLEGELGLGARLDLEMQDYSGPITNGYTTYGRPTGVFTHGSDSSDIETFHNELWFKNKDVVHVSSWVDLQNAVDNASFRQTIVLDKDLDSGDETRIRVRDGHHVIIDLNGHDLDRDVDTPWSGGYATNGHVIEVLDEGTELTLKDSAGGGRLIGGWAEHGGGVCVGKNATFIMDGGKITNCSCDYGGGVYVKGTFIMNGGTIKDCRADNDGGGVYITGSGKAYLYGGRIQECRVGIDGGGIFQDDDGVLTIEGVYIGHNYAESSGGGLYLKDETTIKNCEIDANETRKEHGGGIVFKGSDKTLYIYGTTFNSNETYDSGGALIMDKGKAQIDGCIFKVNKCKGNSKGGAIYLCDGTQAIIKNSQFNVNSSADDGGAMYVNNGAKAEVENCLFHDNEAKKGSGGAIFVDEEDGAGELIVSNTIFRENSCNTDLFGNDGYGGAIFSEGELTIKNGCQFVENEARSGGAVYINYGECNIFSDPNEAMVEFIGNKTRVNHGGAIYIDDGTLNLKSTHMTSNDALERGGAIYAEDDAEINISGTNVIQGNMAGTGSDVYLMDDIKLNLTGSIGASYIYVSIEDKTGIFTSDYSKYCTTSPGNLFFNSEGLEVVLKDGEAALQYAGPVTTKGEFIPWRSQINDGSLSGSNWMSALSGDRYLYEINIPGSADSASKDCDDSHDYEAQDRYIDEQLNDGIRLLNIKVANTHYVVDTFIVRKEMDDGGLWVVLDDGNIRCYDSEGDPLSFTAVLDMVKDFLKKHPTETVIINIEAINKEDDKTGTTARLAAYIDALSKEINPNTGDSYLYYEGKDPCAPLTHVPQIKECRGKIVFMSNSKDVDIIGGMCPDRLVGQGHVFRKSLADTDIGTDFWFFLDLLGDYIDVFDYYQLKFRVQLPVDASHSDDPIFFIADTHTHSGFAFSLKVLAKLVNKTLFYDREQNEIFFPKGDYFGFLSVDLATANKAHEIWNTNFFTKEDFGPIVVRDGLQYRTISVRSGLDEGLYPMQTYKLLKGTIIDIPFSIYEYDQDAHNNYLEGWLITDTTGTKLYKPGEQYRLIDDDVEIVASWTQGTLQTPIHVVWADGNNYDELRPETLLLKINDEDYTVKALGEWRTAYTGPIVSIEVIWDMIDPEDDGKYSCEITGGEGMGYTIRLCHTPDATINIFGKVFWSNDNLIDLHHHPDSVTICLFEDGKLRTTSTAWNETYFMWGFVFLPRFADGHEVKYEVTQMPIAGYETYSQGWSIINVKQNRSEYADYAIIWNDVGNENRPANLTLTFKPTESSQGFEQTITVCSQYNFWQSDGIKFGKVAVDDTSSLTITCPDGYTAEITKLDDSNQLFSIVLTPIENLIGEVEELIDAIGEVEATLESKIKIDAARTAYDALPGINKPFVHNYGVLFAAEVLYAILTAEEQDAEKVKELIHALRCDSEGHEIPLDEAVTNTPQFLHGLTNARNAYDHLSDTMKEYVTNYDDLLYMENRYNELVKGKSSVKVTVIWNDNNNSERPDKIYLNFKPTWDAKPIRVEVISNVPPSFDQNVSILVKSDVDETASLTIEDLGAYDIWIRYDKETDTYIVVLTIEYTGSPVKAVENLIDAIGSVVYSVECKERIDNARSEYENLSDIQKMAVRNYEALPAAEAEYNVKAGGEEAVISVMDRIDAIDRVVYTHECRDKISAARTLYDMLNDQQKEGVTNYADLEAAEAAYAELVEDNVKAKIVDAMINQIELAKTDEERQIAIIIADAMYQALTDVQKSMVTNYDILERAKGGPQEPVVLFRLEMTGWTYGNYDPSVCTPILLDYYDKPYVHPEGLEPEIKYTDIDGNIVEPSDSLPAGTYYVVVSFEAGEVYHAATKMMKFKVDKAVIDLDSVKAELDKYVYDGTEAKVTATVGDLTLGEDFTVTVQQNGEEAILMNAGIYEVILTIINPNYRYSDGETSHTVTFQIERAQNDIISLIIIGWNEGDEPNAPIVISPYGSDTAVFTYSDSQYGDYTDEVPTTAGTWYVRATIASNNQYNGAMETASFTIAPPDTPVTKTYMVRFDPNGAEASTLAQTFNYDEAKALDACTFTRDGYGFVGWNTKADGAGTAYSDRQVVKNLIESGTIRLYAMWGKEYTAYFDPNGGSSPSFDSKTVVDGLAYGNLPSTYRSDYDFNGWFTDSGDQISAATTFTGSEDITLFAHWSATPGPEPPGPGPDPPGPEPEWPKKETEEEVIVNPDGSITDRKTETTTYEDGSFSERIDERTVEKDGTETTREASKTVQKFDDGSMNIFEIEIIEHKDERTVYSKNAAVDAEGKESSRCVVESVISSDVVITTKAISEKNPQGTSTASVSTVLDTSGVESLEASHIDAAVDNAEKIAEMLDPEGTVIMTLNIDSGSEAVISVHSDGLKTLAENEMPLVIISEAGTLSYDNDVVTALSNKSGTVTLSMKIDDVSALNESQRAVIGDATFISVTATAGSERISELGGIATMTFEFTNPQAWEEFAAYYVDDEGNKTLVDWSYDGKFITVLSDHHSIYAVLEVAEEPVIVDDDDNTIWIIAGAVAAIAIAAILVCIVIKTRRS